MICKRSLKKIEQEVAEKAEIFFELSLSIINQERK